MAIITAIRKSDRTRVRIHHKDLGNSIPGLDESEVFTEILGIGHEEVFIRIPASSFPANCDPSQFRYTELIGRLDALGYELSDAVPD